MNDMIRDAINGYLDIFNGYSITDSKLQAEVDDYKKRLISFGNDNSDITTYYQKFAESGLQEEFTSLITKVAMASMNQANESTDSNSNETDVMSVQAFVEQYRTGYDEIKKAGYRKRAEKAYEDIFEVANRTDDMIEAQLIFEKERLLWNIVTTDSIDIFEATLQAMDPLQPSTTKNLLLQLEAYRKAQSDEELTFLVETQEIQLQTIVEKEKVKILIATMLSSLLMKYFKNKVDIWKWEKEIEVKGAISGIILLRHAIKRTLKFMKDNLDMSFDDLLKDEGMKIWLLLPTPVDDFGRIKTSLHSSNYQIYQDIVHNEIEKELSIEDILLRKLDGEFYFDLDTVRSTAYNNKAQQKAKQLNGSLIYYQYLASISK